MSQTATRIGILHHIGGGNLGDDATFRAITEAIKARRPDAEVCAFTMNPSDSALRHGVPAYPLRRDTWHVRDGSEKSAQTSPGRLRAFVRRSPVLSKLAGSTLGSIARFPKTLLREWNFIRAAHRQVMKLDLLVIGGGGQLTERDGAWAFPYTLLKWTVLARLAKVRCVALNVGAGPVSGALSKMFVRRMLSLAQYVSFRDRKSESLVHAFGFKGASQVVTDCAYSLDTQKLLSHEQLQPRTHDVGFAAVPFGEPRLHPNEKSSATYDLFLRRCRHVVTGLVKVGFAVCLFGTDIGVDDLVQSDLERTLRASGSIRRMHQPESSSLGELFTEMQAMDYIITCRFHGVVFAHLLNKPVIAIAHHPKVTDLMAELGLSRYCFDIETFAPEAVLEAFASLVDDADAVKKSMSDSLLVRQRMLATQFDELFPALSDVAPDLYHHEEPLRKLG